MSDMGNISVLIDGTWYLHTNPWVVSLLLILTTFIFEDVAIAAGAALAVQGSLSWPVVFFAVAGGIAIGDLGLYACGLGARDIPWLHKKYIAGRSSSFKDGIEKRLVSVVLLARVIPGLRLVTYTVCGFSRVRFLPFTLTVTFAVIVWTAGLFLISTVLGKALSDSLHIPAPIAVALPIILIALAIPAIKWLFTTVSRKAVE